LKILTKYGVLLIIALCLSGGTSEVFAFSIGEFQVQSKFGGKFKASFEVNLDFNGPVEVSLGDVDDYRKLELDRQGLIDALIIDSIEQSEKLKKTIHIRSNNPLFFPSFNLVVRATHNEGTLLENFLVTVDFQQSLALNVQQKKKNTTALSKNAPLKEPLKNQGSISQPLRAQQQEKEVSKKAVPEDKAIVVVPEGPSKFLKSETLNQKSKLSPEVSAEEVLVPQVPVPAKTQVVHRRRSSGVIWAYPRSIPDWTIPNQDDVVKTEKVFNKARVGAALTENPRHKAVEDLTTSYVLRRGEGLFSVARKLKIKNSNPAQVAIAIWMNNIDKFIIGNINGIRAGVKLDVGNLEETLFDIDLETARSILKGQTLEWRLTKKTAPVDAEVSDKRIIELPLPSERLEDYASLFEQVIGWQTTWGNMDIENHLAYYQDLKPENPFQVRKKKFLSLHPKPRLGTSSKMLVFKEGVPLVFFEQGFSSENLKSRGLKELEWTLSKSSWKIRGEKFYKKLSHSAQKPLANPEDFKVHDNKEKTIKLSFVIHVSSHADKPSTVSVTNKLRKNGFDAYWVPVRVSREIEVYRVYVGRFADWNQAHRVVRILRKKDFGGHATAIPYPFALEVGKVNSLVEARVLLESLRKSGLSGLLLVSHNDSTGIRLRVVVGAFKKAGNAHGILQRLKESGFTGNLISP
jgi:hypothetical protein